MNVAMPIAAVMLDLGFPAVVCEGRSVARADSRPARPSGRGATAAARLPAWPGRPRRRSTTSERRTTGSDAHARGRSPSLGRAAGARRCGLPRLSSPISSNARPSTARSWRRRDSPRPKQQAAWRTSRELPLTEKAEIRPRARPTIRSARISVRRRPRSSGSTRRAARPARRATSRSRRAISTTG